jgi:SAM-dependent methyltransferase
LLKRAVPEGSSPSLLDVGCGTGYSLLWLKELLRARAAFGVDASFHATRFWRLRGIDTAAIASAAALPFASGSFDLVTCFDVIYQFGPGEARRAVSEMQRVLRPGGLLLIREPAYEWLRGSHDVAVATRHRFTRARLASLLAGEGFVRRRATYTNTLLFPAAAGHRLVSRLRGSSASDVKPVPGWMNRLMLAALKVEARLLDNFTFPFGLSVVMLAEKRSLSNESK